MRLKSCVRGSLSARSWRQTCSSLAFLTICRLLTMMWQRIWDRNRLMKLYRNRLEYRAGGTWWALKAGIAARAVASTEASASVKE